MLHTERTERTEIDLGSFAGIDRTYEYYRDLVTNAEQSLMVHAFCARTLHPRQIWAAGAEESIAELREDNGRVLWLPHHISNVDPFVEAAASYQDATLRQMIGRVSIFTKPDWYDKPLIGKAVRSLYDTVPAIPISRHPNQAFRDYANTKAVHTMIHRMIEKQEDGVLYATKHRMKKHPQEVPPADKLAKAPELIAAKLREIGIPLKFLVTGRWLGDRKVTRRTTGFISPMLFHSVIDVPEDLSHVRTAIRNELINNIASAREHFVR